jgi:IstB-like ATP binding protein
MRWRGHPHQTRQHRTKMLQSVAITAGTGKSHVLVALGISAVAAGHKVRYFTAAGLEIEP